MLTALKTLLAYYVKTPEQGADLEEAEPWVHAVLPRATQMHSSAKFGEKNIPLHNHFGEVLLLLAITSLYIFRSLVLGFNILLSFHSGTTHCSFILDPRQGLTSDSKTE